MCGLEAAPSALQRSLNPRTAWLGFGPALGFGLGGALHRPSARSESIRAAAAAGAARARAAGVTATRGATNLRPWLTPSLGPWPSCEAKG